MKINPIGHLVKTNPNKANSNPIKANLLDAQMNVSKVLTKDYENKSNWKLDENKPNTNPIKPNFKGKKMLPHLTTNGRKIVQGEKLNCITYS